MLITILKDVADINSLLDPALVDLIDGAIDSLLDVTLVECVTDAVDVSLLPDVAAVLEDV